MPTTQLHWIEGPWRGKLAIAARPRGGDWIEDEMRSWQKQGIAAVVSLLTADETAQLELDDERDSARHAGLDFISLPIEDRTAPASDAAAHRIVEQILNHLSNGRSAVIHCRQGIGRAASIAIATLLAEGVPLPEAIARVEQGRRLRVPETPEQLAWLKQLPQRTAESPPNAKIA